jgi:transcriptional regulator
MIYIPAAFAEPSEANLYALMRRHPFATLIAPAGGKLEVSHLPLLADEGTGLLRGHLARANPQWRSFSQDSEVIALFHGPHHYISPAWYGTHPSVPTWNYAVVHAHGVPRLIDDPGELERMLAELTQIHESGMSTPWEMDLPRDYMDAMLRGIVGFEIRVTRLEGKFKLSQNRPPADRPRVVAALEALANDDALGIAALMRERGR